MSQYIRMKLDPKADKGVCSTCRYLSVRVSETGDERVLCQLPEAPFTITKKVAHCTDHEKAYPQPNGDDAAIIYDNDPDEGWVAYTAGNRLRFKNGRWEKRVPGKDPWNPKWVAVDEKKAEAIETEEPELVN